MKTKKSLRGDWFGVASASAGEAPKAPEPTEKEKEAAEAAKKAKKEADKKKPRPLNWAGGNQTLEWEPEPAFNKVDTDILDEMEKGIMGEIGLPYKDKPPATLKNGSPDGRNIPWTNKNNAPPGKNSINSIPKLPWNW